MRLNVRRQRSLHIDGRCSISSAIAIQTCACLAAAGMWFAAAPPEAIANVRLPSIFTDHMVLQRQMPLPVWGWASPGEAVTVKIADQTHTTRADETGKWRVTLASLSPGGPVTLEVSGNNKVLVSDILIGEVWICAGQSNMEWPVKDSANADLVIATADHPDIRLITVATPGTEAPEKDFHGHWETCTPQSIVEFSAVGYGFGCELLQHLHVPIGLIDVSWGGSACEAWNRRDRMEGNPLYAGDLENSDKSCAAYKKAPEWADYTARLEKWRQQAHDAEQAGEHEPAGRPSDVSPVTSQGRAGNIYNSRLTPIMPFGIRGVIWYQGESNVGRGQQYREMFPLLIQSWRKDWAQGDFPFYWVQLANFAPEPLDQWAELPELREAQTLALDRLPNTGQAVIIDLGDAHDIHPRNKLEVAKRLARLALTEDYSKKFACRSPQFDSMEKQPGRVLVRMKDVGDHLITTQTGRVLSFEIAGEDQKWVNANALIVGKDTIEAKSESVREPVAVRYAWAGSPVCNLYSDDGLPATPFRTDDWPRHKTPKK